MRQTYSKAKDAAQLYEIKVKTVVIKQGSKSVTKSGNLLQNMWQELDHYQAIKLKCNKDAAIVKAFIESDGV